MIQLSRQYIRLSLLVIAFFLSTLLGNALLANDKQSVFLLTINDVIGPSTEDYIERSIDKATLEHAPLVVIQIDTPGGLDSAMRNIIKKVVNSSVPVVTFVSPGGARAASAGTYLLYASHIAAMSPGTNLGAATPVKIGGISPLDKKPGEDDKAPKPETEASKMEKKVINDAVAYIRGLAQLRGRNQEWAEKAVREGVSLPASDALKQNIIDIIAVDMADLLQQIDGREVLIRGQKQQLKTEGLMVKEMNPDWRNRLLSVITNPNIAYILMLVGIYGLIFEFSNPGSIVPGTVGAICLLLAMYSFQLLPINYAGIALILLGVALMVGEAFEPSFGILGIGGLVAFVFGSIILIDTEVPGFGIDISVIVAFAISSVIIFVFVIEMAVKARRRPVVSGMEELLGSEAVVMDDFEKNGRVKLHSESWKADSESPLKKGQQVKVVGVDGLTLKVKPLPSSEQE